MASADTAEMSLMQMCALFRASDLGFASDLNVKETTHAAAAALGLHDDRSQPTMELAKGWFLLLCIPPLFLEPTLLGSTDR